MAFHLDCYNSTHENQAKGRPARYRSKCEAETCMHDGWIQPGQSFTWTRNKGAETSDTAPAPAASGLESLLAAAIMPQIQAKIDAMGDVQTIADEVCNVVLARMAETQAMRVEIVLPTGDVKDAGIQHKQFPLLLKALAAKANVWLAGPSGSGKTTAAIAAANALSLEFRYTGAVGDAYALIGYNDANGKYVRTPFREAWEHGGIFLWDEVDASDPSALLAFNAALANGTMVFPDGMVKKHENCVLIAAANTYGHGATHEYVGRMKLDMAFLKRFAFISWGYDEELELATAPNPAWTKRVQAIRKRVAEKKIRVMVTPRESYIGASLLAAGIGQPDVENMTVRSGMTDDQWAQVAN